MNEYSSSKKLLEQFTTRVVLEYSSTRGSPTDAALIYRPRFEDFEALAIMPENPLALKAANTLLPT